MHGMNWELPVQKCMVQMLHKLAELPVAIVQHNLLLFCIIVTRVRLQQLNLFPTTYVKQCTKDNGSKVTVEQM